MTSMLTFNASAQGLEELQAEQFTSQLETVDATIAKYDGGLIKF